MREYYGNTSKIYKQTIGKRLLLIPAVLREIKNRTGDGKLLDIGCGNGDFFEIAKNKGYSCYGLDVQEDMLERAKEDFPEGKYLCSSSTEFASKYRKKFDIILISMLFPAFNNKQDNVKTLEEAKHVLSDYGKIIIGVPHPCFDNYMIKGLFGKDDVETDFKDYFTSGQKYVIHYDFGGKIMDFKDHHWLLDDYMYCLKESGLVLKNLDECKPDETVKGIEAEIIKQKRKYPTYLVLVVGMQYLQDLSGFNQGKSFHDKFARHANDRSLVFISKTIILSLKHFVSFKLAPKRIHGKINLWT